MNDSKYRITEDECIYQSLSFQVNELDTDQSKPALKIIEIISVLLTLRIEVIFQLAMRYSIFRAEKTD